MNLGFKVKLDTDHEAGVLELAVVVNGTLEEVSCRSIVSVFCSWPIGKSVRE